MIAQMVKSIYLNIKKNKILLVVFVFGLSVRLLYTYFFSDAVAQSYFNQQSLHENSGDFRDWLTSFRNLVEKGTYTLSHENPHAAFSRMPGYAIFIALFYYLFDSPTYLFVIGYFQVFLDSLNIIMIYYICRQVNPNFKFHYIPSILFAISPINIFWAPTLFSETLSVFILFLVSYIYCCSTWKCKYLFMGLLIGFGILVRPQLALFALAFVFFSICTLRSFDRIKIASLSFFIIGICCTYGIWPVRNYVFHNKFILTHDIRGTNEWGIDVYSYMQYNFSVQTYWEPQFSQIIKNKKLILDPNIYYATPSDSIDLSRAIYLAKNKGSGFSHWTGYWQNKIIPLNSSDTIIASLFNKLYANQVKYNRLNYWLYQPLKTLRKLLFKESLENSRSLTINLLASVMFITRSFLIILGFVGSLLFLRRGAHALIYIILFFALGWYALIAFGPPGYFRNVEIRYLIQSDSLLLIPAAFAIEKMIELVQYTLKSFTLVPWK